MHRTPRHPQGPLVAVVLLGTALMQASPLATPLAAQSARVGMAHAPVASRAIGSATVMAAHVVNITTTDYAFDMPATLPSGLTTMRLANKGKELHHVYLVKVPAG
ncbi:hypothetical protein, partial [Gemmatimonas sp.]